MKKAMGLNIPLGWICSTALSMTLLSLRLLEEASGSLGPINKIIQLGVCWIGYLSLKSGNKKNPKVKLKTLTRVGSNHCLMLLDDGTRNDQIKRWFRFEIAWLSQSEFRRKLTEKLSARRGESVQDFWKRLKKELR
jgi:hypothetical protein